MLNKGMAAIDQNRSYSQHDWGPLHVKKKVSRLGYRYDFLKDPDINSRLTKINKEISYTEHKIKKKRSNRIVLSSFLIFSSAAILFFTAGLSTSFEWNFFWISTSAILFLYCVGVFVLFRSLLSPMKKSIKRLKGKMHFLTMKQREALEEMELLAFNKSSAPKMNPSLNR